MDDDEHLAQLRTEHLHLIFQGQIDAALIVEAEIARLEHQQR